MNNYEKSTGVNRATKINGREFTNVHRHINTLGICATHSTVKVMEMYMKVFSIQGVSVKIKVKGEFLG